MLKLCNIFRDARGAASVEYSLIIAIIFLALVAGVVSLSGAVAGSWNSVSEEVQNAS